MAKPRQRSRPRRTGSLYRGVLLPWLVRKGPVLQVAMKFVFLMVLYYALTLLPFYDRALDDFVNQNARLASILLNWLGEQSHVYDSTVWSSQFAITIQRACAALEYPWFLCAAMIAFPAPFIRKIPGILAAWILLPALNLLRAISLYLVGVHLHSYFDLVHEELWGVPLIAATAFLLTGWIKWARRDDNMVAA